MKQFFGKKSRSALATVLIISLALHVVAILVFGTIKLVTEALREETVFEAVPIVPPPQKEPEYTVNIQQRNQSTPPPRPPAIVVNNPSELDIPALDIDVNVDNSSVYGRGGGGFGGGLAGIREMTISDFLPPSMSGRCSPQERTQRLLEMGGTRAGERAVEKALNWLKKTQNDDGSWTGKQGQPYPVAMTGMAILAFLGHCETPKSPYYGETVTRGIVYLIDQGMKDGHRGLLCSPGVTNHATAYEHGIAAYALAEAYTLCTEVDFEIPNLKKVTKKVNERILDGQTNAGGYVYQLPSGGNGGDNSVGFWQMQALKAYKHTKIGSTVKIQRHIRKSMEWLESVQGPNGAIGYRNDPNRSPGLTGGALLCMQFWGEGESRAAKKAAEYIRENTKFVSFGDKSANLYYHYYNAQAMINVGGEDWKWYNNLVRDKIIDAQQPDGSWKQKMQHGPVNDHMATCLATMLLEVYYRFLPGTSD